MIQENFDCWLTGDSSTADRVSALLAQANLTKEQTMQVVLCLSLAYSEGSVFGSRYCAESIRMHQTLPAGRA